jgi:N-acetylglutamate synthase-like GNAT family acetyltransferase
MERRQIAFCTYEGSDKAALDLHQLQSLLQDSAFWAQDRSIGDLEIAVANSHPVIGVWNGGQLIGFARTTSDGIYRATLWDVVVRAEYRGLGIGRELVDALLRHPRLRQVEKVYLMTTYQQDFYERLGFQRNPTTTMVLYAASRSDGAQAAANEAIATPYAAT